MINKNNFYRNTFAIFQKVEKPIESSKIHYHSKYHSKYIFTEKGVFRYSNHWGRVGNCRWRLEGVDYKQQKFFWGFALWENFFPNDVDKAIFFIEKTTNENYIVNHKANAPTYITQYRTAKETAKVIQKLKEIYQNTQWAKHLYYENYEELKNFFVEKLTTTNLTFTEVQRLYKLKNKEE